MRVVEIGLVDGGAGEAVLDVDVDVVLAQRSACASWPSGSMATRAPPAYLLAGTSGDSAAPISSRVQARAAAVRGAGDRLPAVGSHFLPGRQDADPGR